MFLQHAEGLGLDLDLIGLNLENEGKKNQLNDAHREGTNQDDAHHLLIEIGEDNGNPKDQAETVHSDD